MSPSPRLPALLAEFPPHLRRIVSGGRGPWCPLEPAGPLADAPEPKLGNAVRAGPGSPSPDEAA